MRYTVQKGENAAFIPLHGATAGQVVIEPVGGDVPCVSDVEAGDLFPATTGLMYPAFAVSG